MHDMPIAPDFDTDCVWTNYLIDFGEKFSETISVCSEVEKGHFCLKLLCTAILYATNVVTAHTAWLSYIKQF